MPGKLNYLTSTNVYIVEIGINFYLYGGPGHTESFMDLLDPAFLQPNRE